MTNSLIWHWKKWRMLLSETLNPTFNCSVHDRSKLIQFCMITSCIPALIITLHVLVFLCCIPTPIPPPLLLFPPANSGSNETSIWPVRKTQTSLPLWEEEPSSCSGRTNGTLDCQKNVNGQMMMFFTLDVRPFSLSLESSISLRQAGLQTRWKDGRKN